ncbi:DUF3592 domain-containing protein [Pseudofrankia asymbiotica]|uniref:DUF3592 domain-containing protein n=1 Tax=Pseudofrankia asymbiotica TaxID=1834516 RepID=UPI001F520E05|nr:DUF3592 domain-containing protein [Pseudofrankia asymbiotica]
MVTAEVVDAGGPHEPMTARFVTHAGVPIVTRISTGGSNFRVGEHLTVEYDESDPTRARERDSSWNWGLPIGLAVFGLAMPAVAIWIFLRRRREYPGWEPLRSSEIVRIFEVLSVPWWPAGGLSTDTTGGARNHKAGCVRMLRRDQQEIGRVLPGWDLHGVGDGRDQGRWRAGQRLSMTVDEVWCRRGRGEPWRVKVFLVEQPLSPGTAALPFRD